MSFLDGLATGAANVGTSLWNGVKNTGDFLGLDGSFGYNGTWNGSNPSFFSQSNVPGASAVSGGYDTNTGYSPVNSMYTGLTNVGSDVSGFLKSNPWVTDAAKIGASMYQANQTADMNKGLIDLQRQQMALTESERQRQIGKEKEQENNLMAGFNFAGFR